MKQLKLLSLLLMAALAAVGQTLTPKPGVQLASGVGGYYEYLPKIYDGTRKVPLILFFHGIGNRGNGTTDLKSVSEVGLIDLIARNQVPDQGMVVIAPQFADWPTPNQSLQVLNKILQLYPSIDTERIYVTGLSMGGGAAWELAALAGTRIAAVAPICGASTPDASRIKALVSAGTPIFAFHAQDDPTVPAANTHGYVDGANAQGINPRAVKYIYPTGGHNIWNDAYLPYQGIYEFFRKHSRASAKPQGTIRISASQKPPAGWLSDESYVTFTRGYWGGTDAIWGSPRTFTGTQEQALYQFERWGDFRYGIPVSNGEYTVRFHFAEIYVNSAGKRVFSVDVEGKRALNNLDIFMLTGARFVALQRQVNTVVSDGILDINFITVVDAAQVIAIEVTPGKLAPQSVTVDYLDANTNQLLRSRTDTFPGPVKVIVRQ